MSEKCQFFEGSLQKIWKSSIFIELDAIEVKFSPHLSKYGSEFYIPKKNTQVVHFFGC